MSSLKFSASRIHDGRRFLPEGSVVECADSGEILAVHGPEAGVMADRHFETGVLTPGFVNAHCHLELSHMKGAVPEGTGLMVFLQQVIKLRGVSEEAKAEARKAAAEELLQAGVVAVGDISNTADTADLRAAGTLRMHTFVEALGFLPQTATKRFDAALEVWQQLRDQAQIYSHLSQSITPHAPYSVSPELFRLIDAHDPGGRISIHNAESEDEAEFYREGTGGVVSLLDAMGMDISFYKPYGEGPLSVYGSWIGGKHPILFIHNTRATAEEIQWAQGRFKQAWWCLCPGANRYIEGRLPDVEMLMRETENLCIGTDSLASNHQLSVLAELQLLKTFFPSLDWEDLLRWGTANGAAALGMEQHVGALTPGTKPGLVHIEDLSLGTPQRIL